MCNQLKPHALGNLGCSLVGSFFCGENKTKSRPQEVGLKVTSDGNAAAGAANVIV
jgi:hypothetical protein